MYKRSLFLELDLKPEIACAVKRKMRKDRRHIRKMAQTAYCAQTAEFPLCRKAPLTRLAVLVYLLSEKYEAYQAMAIPDEIIFDTFRDVSLRADIFYQKNGKAGLEAEDVVWFRHIMKTNIFKLGELQFQPFEMIYLDEETLGEEYMLFEPDAKKRLPPGCAVINCHIPRRADISKGSVQKSLEAATAFFKTYFPQVTYRAFLCYSWMLYPPMLHYLAENSNIKTFANRFEIVGSCPDAEQAMENLFACGKKLPAKPTTLQQLALEHKPCFGFGCGIIFCKG